jgi:hypothetical protein
VRGVGGLLQGFLGEPNYTDFLPAQKTGSLLWFYFNGFLVFYRVFGGFSGDI